MLVLRRSSERRSTAAIRARSSGYANGFLTTSSPPRSSTRIRCSRSASRLSTINGVSGSTRPARPSPERIASTSPSVPPLTSTRIRSGSRRAQQRDRLRAVGRDQHPVAVGGQVVGEERARGVVLLGQQDGRIGKMRTIETAYCRRPSKRASRSKPLRRAAGSDMWGRTALCSAWINSAPRRR